MTRNGNPRPSQARAQVGLALVCLAFAFACTSPRIRVDASDASPLRSLPGFDVALAPAQAGTKPALPEVAVAALLERTREALRARGHPIDEDAEDAVAFQLSLREEQAERRTYTADADANGTRIVKRTEAVVALRVLGPDGKTEIWRCEARGLVPVSGGVAGAGGEALYDRLLERALARIPARP